MARGSGVGAALGFAALCLGMFMAILDVQIVATALPTLEQALTIAPENLSWIQTAYLLAEIVSIPLTGPLQRTFGLRRLVVTALIGFTAASLGCASSSDFASLVAWRLIQGFSGGVLIPVVFGSVFLLFPPRRQPLATTMAGMVAVLAPTVGPLLGGTVTVAWSWHALFLINLPFGFLATVATLLFLPRGPRTQGGLRDLDGIALLLMAGSLAALVLALKHAPEAGWAAPATLGLLAGAGLGGTLFVRRTLFSPRPLIALRLLGDRAFAVGCGLSFVFGLGLFGSVYLLPLFLGLVRGHDPREIGRIMLVTGVAQLAAAPLVAWLETRLDARPLTLFGFILFAIGLALGARQTISTDAAALFWPQILRGIGIMVCLVPTTRFALGRLPPDRIPDASGLFNLMRNLGGAIGLASIDTLLYGRTPDIGRGLQNGLQVGDAAAATTVGLPPAVVAAHAGQPLTPDQAALVTRLVGHAALTLATNEAWLLLALATAAPLPLLAVLFRKVPGDAAARTASVEAKDGSMETIDVEAR